MKYISHILRALLALMGVVLIGQGILWGFFPDGNLEANGIELAGALGRNMVKSDIGGGLLAAGGFLVPYGSRQGFWFFPATMIAASYLLIRAVSLAVDGYAEMAAIGVALETVVLVLLLVARRLEMRLLSLSQSFTG
jgi:hypothetical protein